MGSGLTFRLRLVKVLQNQFMETCVSNGANTKRGITVLAGSFDLYLNSVTESVVAPND